MDQKFAGKLYTKFVPKVCGLNKLGQKLNRAKKTFKTNYEIVFLASQGISHRALANLRFYFLGLFSSPEPKGHQVSL